MKVPPRTQRMPEGHSAVCRERSNLLGTARGRAEAGVSIEFGTGVEEVVRLIDG